MGAVAVGPDGRVWAGTGEQQPGGGSSTYGGTGIYTSPNGGKTWNSRGLKNSGATGAILTDPVNPAASSSPRRDRSSIRGASAAYTAR